MDSKFSALPVVVTPTATDMVPVVVAGVNKIVTVGVLANNMPNIGNKGITTNAVQISGVGAIPLTKTVFRLNTVGAYTLASGSDGQELKIIGGITGATVSFTSSQLSSASFNIGGVLSLIFATGLGWMIVSKNNVTTT